MSITVIIVVFLLSIMLFCLTSCKDEAMTKNKPRTITVGQVKQLSTKQVEEMLENIERRIAPKEQKKSAMCYSVVMPSGCIEYSCPTCGEKTLYEQNYECKGYEGYRFIAYELRSCRHLMSLIKRENLIDVLFDESAFCKKCKPDTKKQTATLIIKYNNGETYRTENAGTPELLFLHEFLKGKFSHTTKENLPRLREVLGIKLENEKK